MQPVADMERASPSNTVVEALRAASDKVSNAAATAKDTATKLLINGKEKLNSAAGFDSPTDTPKVGQHAQDRRWPKLRMAVCNTFDLPRNPDDDYLMPNCLFAG